MAVAADPQATKTIQLTLRDLTKQLKKVETTRKVSEVGLEAVNALHSEVEAEGVLSVTNQAGI